VLVDESSGSEIASAIRDVTPSDLTGLPLTHLLFRIDPVLVAVRLGGFWLTQLRYIRVRVAHRQADVDEMWPSQAVCPVPATRVTF
jgi:hypothetical protein